MEINGDAVKRLRFLRALSQRELGQMAGVSAETVLEIEHGQRRRVYPKTLRKIAEVLGVEPRELTLDDDEGKAAPVAA